MVRAELDKQPSDVRRMFDAVARRYDVTNDVLSWARTASGVGRSWPRSTRARGAGPRPRRRDGCRASRSPSGARSGPVRLLPRHAPGRQAARPHLPFTAGDGTRLPFADGTFDAVTISFGLRNIVDPLAGLASCAGSHPADPGSSSASSATRPGRPSAPWPPRVPHAGAAPDRRAVSSSPDAYVYLAVDPGVAGPAGPRRARSPRPAGATQRWRNLSSGIVASTARPPDPQARTARFTGHAPAFVSNPQGRTDFRPPRVPTGLGRPRMRRQDPSGTLDVRRTTS